MIIFKDGLKLENKILEQKLSNHEGFQFTYKGKDYTHKDVFASPPVDHLDALRKQLRLKGIIHT